MKRLFEEEELEGRRREEVVEETCFKEREGFFHYEWMVNNPIRVGRDDRWLLGAVEGIVRSVTSEGNQSRQRQLTGHYTIA